MKVLSASVRERIEAGRVRSEGACEILVFVEPNDYLRRRKLG
jgi:hypothetical protein